MGDTDRALGSAGHRAGIRHRVSGRHSGERGAAHDRYRFESDRRRFAVDRERVHAHAGVPHTHRRFPGRPIRASANLPDRDRVVRCCVAALRPRAYGSVAGGRPRAPGRWRGAAHARQPCHPSGIVRTKRPWASGWRMVGALRDRRRNRAVRRRVAHWRRVVASDFPDQRTAGRRRCCRGGPPRSRDARSQLHATAVTATSSARNIILGGRPPLLAWPRWPASSRSSGRVGTRCCRSISSARASLPPPIS